MRVEWANNGETPDENGDYVAQIDIEDGDAGVQVFKGKTHKEVADKLLMAQANATVKIRANDKANRQPEPPPETLEFTPRTLDADERFRLSNEMQNPDTAPEAIRTVVEAELGAPLADVRKRLQKDDEQEQADLAKAESLAFVAANEDYEVCNHNGQLLRKYMEMHHLSPLSRKNFQIAWDALKDAGLAKLKTDETDDDAGDAGQPESGAQGGLPGPVTPTTRKRGVISSTGLRSGDSTGDAGTGRRAQAKWTAAELERMSEEEYRNLLDTNPEFVVWVNAPRKAAQAR